MKSETKPYSVQNQVVFGLLRIFAGWHFLYEGIVKLPAPVPSVFSLKF